MTRASRRRLQGGGILLGMLVLGAVFAPWMTPYSPNSIDLTQQLGAPSMRHWLGQDQDGGDVLTLLLYGARISLLVSVLSVALSLMAGTAVGFCAGFGSKKIEALCLWLMDVVLAFPGLLLAIALAAFQKEPSVWHVVIALSASGWVPFARLVRTQVLKLKSMAFIEAAQTLGASPIQVAVHHLLPNLWNLLLVQISFALAGAIMAESTLSFLGLGVSLDTPSWGALLDFGTQYLLIAPHLSLAPGLAIVTAVLAFQLLGEGLRARQTA